MAKLNPDTVSAVVALVMRRTDVDPKYSGAIREAVEGALAGLEGDPSAIAAAAPRAVSAAIVANNPELAPLRPAIELAVSLALDPHTVEAALQGVAAVARRFWRWVRSWGG